MNLSKSIKKFGAMCQKHSPEILTAIGVVAMISGTVLAVKATPEVNKKIEKATEDKGDKLTVKETVKEVWKDYIPSAVTTVGGITCIVGASATNYKRNAALSAAYALSQKSLSSFTEAVKETISEKQYEEVRSKVNQKELEENPVNNSTIYLSTNGDTLFYEPISRTYFESTIEKVRSGINKVNHRLNSEMYISFEDYIFDMEIPAKASPIDSELGWRTDRGLIDISLDPQFIDDNKIAVVFNYNCYPPCNDFRDLH